MILGKIVFSSLALDPTAIFSSFARDDDAGLGCAANWIQPKQVTLRKNNTLLMFVLILINDNEWKFCCDPRAGKNKVVIKLLNNQININGRRYPASSIQHPVSSIQHPPHSSPLTSFSSITNSNGCTGTPNR